MAATIETKLTDNSKEWSDALKKRFADAGISADKFDEAVKALNKELDSREAKKMAEAISTLADEAEDTSEELEAMQREIIDTSEELQQMDGAARNAAVSAGKLGSYAKDLEKALEDRRVKAYRDEINRLADEMSGLGKAADKAGDEIDGLNKEAGSGVGMLTELGSALGIVKAGFEVLGKGIEIAAVAISELSAQGVPEFVGLQGAINKSRESLLNLAKTDAFRRLAADAAWMLQEVSGSLASVGGGLSQQIGQWHRDVKDEMIRWAGWAKGVPEELIEATINIRDQVQNAASEQNAAEAARIAAEREAELSDPGAAVRDQQAWQETLSLLGDEAEANKKINKLKEEQARLIKEAKDAGFNPSEQKKITDNAQKLIDLENRRFELLKEHKEFESRREQEQWEKELSHIETLRKKGEEAVQAGIEGERRLFLAKEAARQADLQAEQAKVNKLKAFLTGGQMGGMPGMAGPGGQQPNIMAMLGASTQKSVLQQIQDKRGQDAIDKWREEQRSSGKMDQNNMLIDPMKGAMSPEDIKRQQSRTRAQEQAIMRRERAKAYKDARTGNISNEEASNAASDLLQQASEKLIGTNNLNQTQVQALRQLAETARQQNGETAQLQDEVQGILRTLEQVTGRGMNSNSRAQRGGYGR